MRTVQTVRTAIKSKRTMLLDKDRWKSDADLSACSPATRGIWLDWIVAMDDRSTDSLQGTVAQYARMGRCSEAESAQALKELQDTRAANVDQNGDTWTVLNRRRTRTLRLSEVRRNARLSSDDPQNANKTLTNRATNCEQNDNKKHTAAQRSTPPSEDATAIAANNAALTPEALCLVPTPTGAKRKKDRPVDPRHTPFKLAVQVYCEFKRVLFQWGPDAAKQLDLLLSSTPDLTLAIFQVCLNHRARSPGVPHGEHPRTWLPHILKYQQSPLSTFNKTEEASGSTFKGKTAGNLDAGQQAIDRFAARARALAEGGADSANAHETRQSATGAN